MGYDSFHLVEAINSIVEGNGSLLSRRQREGSVAGFGLSPGHKEGCFLSEVLYVPPWLQGGSKRLKLERTVLGL